MRSQKKSPQLITLTHSSDESELLGEQLGTLLENGDVVGLTGPLGAGKTAFTRGMARGWGALERPTSPTFTLINEYHRQADHQRFYHMDGYRLSGAMEAQTTGLEDVLSAPGVVVLEWADRIADALPADRLWIEIEIYDIEQRRFSFHAAGDRSTKLLEDFKEQAQKLPREPE